MIHPHSNDNVAVDILKYSATKTHLHEKEEINIITEIQRLARVHFQYDMGWIAIFVWGKKYFGGCFAMRVLYNVQWLDTDTKYICLLCVVCTCGTYFENKKLASYFHFYEVIYHFLVVLRLSVSTSALQTVWIWDQYTMYAIDSNTSSLQKSNKLKSVCIDKICLISTMQGRIYRLST